MIRIGMPMMKAVLNLKKVMFGCCVAFALCPIAKAGMVGGPLVVWYNLSQNPEPVDEKVRQYLTNGKAEQQCWTWGARMYMRLKPAAVTRELVTQALVHDDPKAIKSLNRILKTPFGDEVDKGFDGIIAYSDEGGPRYYGLTTGTHRIYMHKAKSHEDVGDAICSVIPEITRAP